MSMKGKGKGRNEQIIDLQYKYCAFRQYFVAAAYCTLRQGRTVPGSDLFRFRYNSNLYPHGNYSTWTVFRIAETVRHANET
jgi:hypothetical protein